MRHRVVIPWETNPGGLMLAFESNSPENHCSPRIHHFVVDSVACPRKSPMRIGNSSHLGMKRHRHENLFLFDTGVFGPSKFARAKSEEPVPIIE